MSEDVGEDVCDILGGQGALGVAGVVVAVGALGVALVGSFPPKCLFKPCME